MKNNTRAIILCAGEATRWGNYRDTRKHLIEINNERILDRTTRLLKDTGIDDIRVITKEYDARYDTENSKQENVVVDYIKNADADKFLSSKHHWNKNGRTILFYGDVYFTEEAIKTIYEFEGKEWTLFCRPDASKITGTPWGECFAISFYDDSIRNFREKLNHIADLKNKGELKRCGGWEVYRAMQGHENLNKHEMSENFVVIDDFTEDFDKPEDFDNWIKNWNAKKDNS